MTQAPRNGIEANDGRTPPAVVLRNEDDAAHALDVRITGGDGVVNTASHTVAGDSQYAIESAGIDSGTLRVELHADNGGAASLTVDTRDSSAPEFVVRQETILVAGLH
ncbi:hypothetical protein C448_03911 [Halococcus morrhuae DSM 1307]|uniref:Uncharacterized protein n=1 Tax=Halococcus morrhuae DSM 1307 TaxID=931277 RepID=M0MRY8_HALMO|nr:hypothetical protein [Halococcus morrhuae]EMA48391.1 hypothetical protein C448_03911 [Halococcus morrhuae DSM 1307]